MKHVLREETVTFSVKGQIVIPRPLRDAFDIERGTQAIVRATKDGILLKPVTPTAIKAYRGLFKKAPDATSALSDLLAMRKRERHAENTRGEKHGPR